MTEAEMFLQHCKLTCFGGSEKGTCDCKSPNDCELRKDPRFSQWRFKAEERMFRHFPELGRILKIDPASPPKKE